MENNLEITQSIKSKNELDIEVTTPKFNLDDIVLEIDIAIKSNCSPVKKLNILHNKNKFHLTISKVEKKDLKRFLYDELGNNLNYFFNLADYSIDRFLWFCGEIIHFDKQSYLIEASRILPKKLPMDSENVYLGYKVDDYVPRPMELLITHEWTILYSNWKEIEETLVPENYTVINELATYINFLTNKFIYQNDANTYSNVYGNVILTPATII